jgi:hypothetical protein
MRCSGDLNVWLMGRIGNALQVTFLPDLLNVQGGLNVDVKFTKLTIRNNLTADSNFLYRWGQYRGSDKGLSLLNIISEIPA